MKKILLVSHGLMAMGTYEAARMIIGENDNIKYICLSSDKGIEDFKKELEDMKDWILDVEQLFVLSDIQGGSPYTTTINFLQDNNLLKKTKVIAGMNLPLLLAIALGQNLDDAQVQNIIAESREGVSLFESCSEDEDEEL